LSLFTEERAGTGTREWSEISYNIQSGCQHNCLYCYAKENALRFKRIQNHEEWEQERIREKAVNRTWSKMDGVIMFPTTHDITASNLLEVITTLKNMLTAGNRVLIVSKPHLVCIVNLCKELEDYKNQILFRFTIGTLYYDLSSFWEPGAPMPDERISCLEHAFKLGYETSVSMEPMLSGANEAIRVYKRVVPYVTDTIWIGKMNKVRSRVDMSIPDNKLMVEQIEYMQRDEAIQKLVEDLKDEPKVRWKDSIKRVIG
jgi:DNA repair photolyase